MKADVVIVSGGVSVGTYDLVNAALDEIGFSRRFWRVRQRPGKPLTFGTVGEKLVFGLPGNPVSTAVCFRRYVRPAIRAMLGLEAGPVHVKARLTEDIEKSPSLHYFVPGRTVTDADGLRLVARSGVFGSHIFSSLAAANCIISIPEGPESVGSGSLVDVELLDDF
jgi:molybdopterin molybdotransferase